MCLRGCVYRCVHERACAYVRLEVLICSSSSRSDPLFLVCSVVVPATACVDILRSETRGCFFSSFFFPLLLFVSFKNAVA